MPKTLQVIILLGLFGVLFLLLQTPELATVIRTSGQRLSNFTAPSSIIVEADTAKVVTLACYAPNGDLLSHNSPESDESDWLDRHHFKLKSFERVDYLNEIVEGMACSSASRNGTTIAGFFIYER